MSHIQIPHAHAHGGMDLWAERVRLTAGWAVTERILEFVELEMWGMDVGIRRRGGAADDAEKVLGCVFALRWVLVCHWSGS